MNHLRLTTTQHSKYSICILVNKIRKDEILKNYITPFNIDPETVLVLDLYQSPTKKKTPKAELKEYVQEVQQVLEDFQIENLFVCDSEYFKLYTNNPKADANIGYVLDSKFGSQKCIYVPNYQSIFYDPEKVTAKINQAITAFQEYQNHTYIPLGSDIIKTAYYPNTVEDIKKWLNTLLEWNVPLTVDTENTSLKHYDAKLGTITFCWNQNEGIAFPIDYLEDNLEIRDALKDFFYKFNNKLIYHNISYDVYILIYQLFMNHLQDRKGLLGGLSVMLKNWDDTKLIAYLATNSCAGNKLSLKEQAQEYTGNYAQEDIKDINKIPLDTLLTYNLHDGLSTWYVHNKHYPKMVADNQLTIYETIFKPAIADIIEMQLTGMPVDIERAREVNAELTTERDRILSVLNSNTIIKDFVNDLNRDLVAYKNSTYKKKVISLADVDEKFNPNSDTQLQKLLFTKLGLPILETTKTGAPATGGDVLKNLQNHTTDLQLLEVLKELTKFKDVDKILSTFIPPLINAQRCKESWYWLFGNFNLGGTKSARLSSNNPNLQNLPAGSTYGKMIKSCFKAPPGWLFTGIDFNGLEDRISALTTKDPNKLKVFIEGYDGHCLRAYFYFKEKMIGIEDTLESINSIAKKYKELRGLSKAPTFALTYQGTWRTLVTNCGFYEQQAKEVESRYHELYTVSSKWVADKLDQACIDGYVTAAFGLRVRTPLLAQTIRGTGKTPREAEAEGRTAGNALGQSWCLLNTRAGSEFLTKVRASKYRLDIKPCAQIHDAQYYLIRDNMDVLLYCNEHLITAVEWQEDPLIAHDEVKLGGEFSIFYPNWSKEVSIPNRASIEVINKHLLDHMESL